MKTQEINATKMDVAIPNNNTKNEKVEINDTKLDDVTGGGEFIEFVDSDDYEHSKTYESA